MSETATETTETVVEEQTTPTGEQAEQKTPEVDWRAKAREWEKRAKANSEAAKRLAEIEEANKSAEQKAAEAHTQAQKRAEAAEGELARYRVALAKGLPADLAGRLRGDTEEDLAADADALLALIGERRPAGPKPDPSQGARPPAASGSVESGRALYQQRHATKT
jgi:predicted Zn-dependent protease